MLAALAGLWDGNCQRLRRQAAAQISLFRHWCLKHILILIDSAVGEGIAVQSMLWYRAALVSYSLICMHSARLHAFIDHSLSFVTLLSFRIASAAGGHRIFRETAFVTFGALWDGSRVFPPLPTHKPLFYRSF